MWEIEIVIAALLAGTLITAVVVGAAVVAHNDGAAARFLRRNARRIYLLQGVFWALVLGWRLLGHGGGLEPLVRWAGLVCMLGLAFFNRPDDEAQGRGASQRAG